MIGIPFAGIIVAILVILFLLLVAPILSAGLRRLTVWIDLQEEKTEEAWKGEPPSKQDKRDS